MPARVCYRGWEVPRDTLCALRFPVHAIVRAITTAELEALTPYVTCETCALYLQSELDWRRTRAAERRRV